MRHHADTGTGAGTIEVSEHLSGRWVRYQLSDLGLVERATSSDGRTATYRYQPGPVAGSQEAEGWQCVAVERPTGGIVYDVDQDGRIGALWDADGVLIAANTYDQWGRVLTQRSPFGRTSRYEYGERGTTRVSDDHGGPTNTMVHDHRGNLLSMVGGDGRAQRMQWDPRDRLASVRDRKGFTTRYEYHPDVARDLLTKTVRPDNSVEERVWDELDRLVQVIDPGDARHTFRYDGGGRYPTTVEDPGGGVTTYIRDERALPTSITDADGVVTSVEWNVDGHVVAISNGDGRRATFDYNAAGELIEVVGVNGERSTFVVDDGGRVTTTIKPTGDRETIEYSAAGRPLRCRNGAGTMLWSVDYGEHGLPASVTDAEGATVRYTYDRFGNRTEIVAPDGDRYGFDYDDLGRLVSVRFGDTGVSGQQHDPNGNVVATTDPDGRRAVREVDELNRTRRVVDAAGAATSYTYHPSGAVATITGPDGGVFAFDVDPMGRVTPITGPAGATTSFE